MEVAADPPRSLVQGSRAVTLLPRASSRIGDLEQVGQENGDLVSLPPAQLRHLPGVDRHVALPPQVPGVLADSRGDEQQGEPGRQHPVAPPRLLADPAQRLERLRGRGTAFGGERLERLDEAGQMRLDPGDRQGAPLLDLPQQLDAVETGPVDRRAGEQLLEQQAEGVHVAGDGDLLAARLLRAHAAGGADHLARRGAGEVERLLGLRDEEKRAVRVDPQGRGGVVVLAEPGDAEVEHLHPAVPGQHDVARLEVAVDDPLGMGGDQGVGDALGDAEPGRGVDPLLDRLAQGLAADQLEDEEVGRFAVDEVIDARRCSDG